MMNRLHLCSPLLSGLDVIETNQALNFFSQACHLRTESGQADLLCTSWSTVNSKRSALSLTQGIAKNRRGGVIVNGNNSLTLLPGSLSQCGGRATTISFDKYQSRCSKAMFSSDFFTHPLP